MTLWFAAFLLCIPLGVGLSALFIANILKKSNVIGDSKSKTEQISDPIIVYSKHDDQVINLGLMENFAKHHLEQLMQTPKYAKAKQDGLDVDQDLCAQGIAMRQGEVLVTDQIVNTIVDMKIEPVTDEELKAMNKRSWKDAVDDSFMDMDEIEPEDNSWHK